MNEIRTTVEEYIGLASIHGRLQALQIMLNINNIEYDVVHTVASKQYKGESTNIIVKLNKPGARRTKHIVIGAHYDVYPRSLGINDNTCAVATLIKFIKEVDTTKLKRNIEVVFFDKEETGMTGSRHYALQNYENTLYAIVLDVVGFGDYLYYSGERQYLKGTRKLLETLPSDNISLMPYIQSTLIVAIPYTDIIFETKTSVFTMNNINNKFYESFHNRELDNDISIINWELLDSLKEKLLDHSYTGKYKDFVGNYVE